MKQMLENMTFGDRQFRFEGHVSALYPTFFFAWVLSALGFLAAFGVFAVTIGDLTETGIFPFDSDQGKIEGSVAPFAAWLVLVLASLAVYALVGLILAFTTAWYHAKEFRYFAQCMSLDGLRFRFRASGLAVFWLTAVNIIIILFTLGLGIPFAQMRKFRFLFRRLSAEGTIDLDAIGQGDAPYPLIGEGLAEFFEIGAV